MATRATIKIVGVNHCKIYKHWDGYPEAMIPFLDHFNKEFSDKRGDDPDYKIAQLLRASKRLENEYSLDSNDFTGWGIVRYDADCDAEYEYELYPDGGIIIKKIEFLSPEDWI